MVGLSEYENDTKHSCVLNIRFCHENDTKNSCVLKIRFHRTIYNAITSLRGKSIIQMAE